MISSTNAWLPAIVFQFECGGYWLNLLLPKIFYVLRVWWKLPIPILRSGNGGRGDGWILGNSHTIGNLLGPFHPSLWSVSHVSTNILRANHVNSLTFEGALIFRSLSTTMLDCRIVCCDEYPSLTCIEPWVWLAPYKTSSFSILRLIPT